ncbi:hypothetical protein E2320_000932, partial [Naja naja]
WVQLVSLRVKLLLLPATLLQRAACWAASRLLVISLSAWCVFLEQRTLCRAQLQGTLCGGKRRWAGRGFHSLEQGWAILSFRLLCQELLRDHRLLRPPAQPCSSYARQRRRREHRELHRLKREHEQRGGHRRKLLRLQEEEQQQQEGEGGSGFSSGEEEEGSSCLDIQVGQIRGRAS